MVLREINIILIKRNICCILIFFDAASTNKFLCEIKRPERRFANLQLD